MAIRIGVDVGGTKILAIVADEDHVLATHRVPTVPGAEGLGDAIIHCVNAALHEAGVSASTLAGIGVGVPGVVDAEGGSVSHAVNIGIGDEPLHLRALLAARYGCPVHVEKDVAAAALGAWHIFGEQHDLALLGLGTGLAAGLVLGGRIRRGASGIAGEVGHLGDVAGGPVCGCGQFGCLNMLASGSALQREWAMKRPDLAATGTGGGHTFSDALASGDPAAEQCLGEVAIYIARACRILVLTVDPAIIALGGGLGGLGDPLLTAVRTALDVDASLSPLLQSLEIADRVRLAPQPNLLGALGAARLV